MENGAELVFDGVHEYAVVQVRTRGRCRVRLYRWGNEIRAVFTMIRDIPRPSLVNNVEQVASEVWQRHAKSLLPDGSAPGTHFLIVEQLPIDGRGRPGETLSVVTLRWEGDAAPRQHPRWEVVSRPEAVARVGCDFD
jgi:hypothetical protein